MDRATTIEEFSTLMKSGEENPLLAALRTLCKVDEPQKVREIRTSNAAPTPDASWGGWAW